MGGSHRTELREVESESLEEGWGEVKGQSSKEWGRQRVGLRVE